MELENLTDSLFKVYNTTKDFTRQNKGYLTAASLSIATKVLETVTTYTCASRFGGFGFEGNPFMKYSVEKLGFETGVFIPTATLVTATLGVAYFGNKKVPEIKPGNIGLYIASGLWGLASLNNLLLAYVSR